MNGVRIWHRGLVARWWAEFNQGGEDLDFFLGQAKRWGGPVLDAGCGTGRVLLPLLRAGFDADGADAADAMLAHCAALAEAEGLHPALSCQPLHSLKLERQYATIIVCGAFGLGGSRADDLEALRRLRWHLLPGGALVLDHYLPNFDKASWQRWLAPADLPAAWPDRGDRRLAADGDELEIRMRQVALDPLDLHTTLEIRACLYRQKEEVAREEHAIHINLYFKPELELMLAQAGFDTVEVITLDHTAPAPWQDERIVFIGRGGDDK